MRLMVTCDGVGKGGSRRAAGTIPADDGRGWLSASCSDIIVDRTASLPGCGMLAADDFQEGSCE